MTRMIDNRDRNRDRSYEFDSLGRLKKAKGGAAAGAVGVTANWTQDYSYDRYGNKTGTAAAGITANSQAVPADGLASLSYNAATNRVNSAGWEYDLAGNLVRGQNAQGVWQRYEYDAAGRLGQVKNDSGAQLGGNGYTSSRQRLFRNENGLTWYVWGGDSVIAEYTSAGWGTPLTWTKSYIYAGSRLLMTAANNGAGGEALEFHHPDRLGTRLVTNNAANTSFEQSTLPFGTALPSESTGFSNQVFTSYDRSPIAGLDYAVNRTYSSGQGRFTQADPIGMRSAKIVNPQSLNLYAYVQNLPTDLVDPLGLCPPGEIPVVEYVCDRIEGGVWECGAQQSCRSLNSRAGNSRGGGGIDADRRRGGGITDPGRKRREPKPEKPESQPDKPQSPRIIPNSDYPFPGVPHVENPAACAVAAIYFALWKFCNQFGGGIRFCQPLFELAMTFLKICLGDPDPTLPLKSIIPRSPTLGDGLEPNPR